MPKLTDETLMLYSDGLLASPEKEHVEILLEEDKDLRSRLQVFNLTGPNLADLMQHHVSAPVPDRLRNYLQEGMPEPFSLARLYQRFTQFAVFGLKKLRSAEDWNFQPAIAVVLAMIAGIGTGWLLRGDSANNEIALNEFLQIEGNQLIAEGALRQTLENAPSGKPSPLALLDDQEIGIGTRMTFRNEAGEYCREYEITVPASKSYAGAACRSHGEWVVKIQTMTAPLYSGPDHIVPAEGNDRLAMDAAINALVLGAPLTQEEEKAVITNRWK